MPNWCMNSMRISHPDPAMMQKVVTSWNGGKFLSAMIPEPDYPGYEDSEIKDSGNSQPDWYDWRIKNWGTKWDIGKSSEDDQEVEINDGEMYVSFNSAWSPPIEAYDKLTEAGYNILAYYFEPGMDFCGKYSYGIDECYTASDMDYPNDIDAELDITETMALYSE